jgi:hypothetical protein
MSEGNGQQLIERVYPTTLTRPSFTQKTSGQVSVSTLGSLD